MRKSDTIRGGYPVVTMDYTRGSVMVTQRESKIMQETGKKLPELLRRTFNKKLSISVHERQAWKSLHSEIG